MESDSAEQDEAKDTRSENQDTSIKHGIYVVAALVGCAVALWLLLEFVS